MELVLLPVIAPRSTPWTAACAGALLVSLTNCGAPQAAEPLAARPARASEPAPAQREIEPTAPPAPDAGATAAADAAPAEPAEPPPPAELPKGSVVLHIGDSFAGALGVPLNEELRARGLVSHLRFKTASFIPNWAGGYDLGAYVEQLKPDLVLITLGANETAMTDPSLRIPQIQKIIRRLGGTPCVWIATPLWGVDNGLMELIREHSAPCRYMDTNRLHPDMPRLSDKIHPTIPARREWAKAVVEWLAAERQPTPDRVWQLRPAPSE